MMEKVQKPSNPVHYHSVCNITTIWFSKHSNSIPFVRVHAFFLHTVSTLSAARIAAVVIAAPTEIIITTTALTTSSCTTCCLWLVSWLVDVILVYGYIFIIIKDIITITLHRNTTILALIIYWILYF
jgi:hypothetical protein